MRAATNFRALLKALLDGGVEFVIIGGLAVAGHGYGRATDDIDICPEPGAENLRRMAAVLERLEAEVLGMEECKPDELPQPDQGGWHSAATSC